MTQGVFSITSQVHSRATPKTKRQQFPILLLKNDQIRDWYNGFVSQINELNNKMQKDGIDADQRAWMNYEIRHTARMEAREMMEENAEAKLQQRDKQAYGSEHGPSFEQTKEKIAESLKTKGKESSSENICQAMIDSATSTNIQYNVGVSLLKGAKSVAHAMIDSYARLSSDISSAYQSIIGATEETQIDSSLDEAAEEVDQVLDEAMSQREEQFETITQEAQYDVDQQKQHNPPSPSNNDGSSGS